MSSVRHLCACEQNIDAHLIRRRLSVNRFALSTTAELFGVVGVPSIMVVNKEGIIFILFINNISKNTGWNNNKTIYMNRFLLHTIDC